MEHSPWIAEQVAAARPFVSVDDLGRAFGDALRSADASAQAGVLRAHPELGAANLERLTRESRASSAAPRSTGSTTPRVPDCSR